MENSGVVTSLPCLWDDIWRTKREPASQSLTRTTFLETYIVEYLRNTNGMSLQSQMSHIERFYFRTLADVSYSQLRKPFIVQVTTEKNHVETNHAFKTGPALPLRPEKVFSPF